MSLLQMDIFGKAHKSKELLHKDAVITKFESDKIKYSDIIHNLNLLLGNFNSFIIVDIKSKKGYKITRLDKDTGLHGKIYGNTMISKNTFTDFEDVEISVEDFYVFTNSGNYKVYGEEDDIKKGEVLDYVSLIK